MTKRKAFLFATLCLALAASVGAYMASAQEGATGDKDEDACMACHRKTTPFIVKDWEGSAHARSSKRRATCKRCHGSKHKGPEDRHLATMPTAKTCKACHLKRYKQYEKGKHALAWKALLALPMTHRLPKDEIQGLKGCGGCHKVGIVTEKDLAPTRFSGNGCAACHGRHRFSREEVRNPRLCARCHTGIDHPQWEMWSTSVHGTNHLSDPKGGRGPTCQTCHFPEGDHENLTAWGFLAVRLPEDDADWMKDRAEILKAYGVIDAEGKPTKLFPLVEDLKLARLTKDGFRTQREKMVAACRRCHGESMVRERFAGYDRSVREADRLFARAIQIVAGLYRDGIIKERNDMPVKGYPFVLDFYDVKTAIEQKLYLMFEEYRMRAVQGAFHDNWDYHHWRGYAKMRKTLVEMEEKARDMRAKGGK